MPDADGIVYGSSNYSFPGTAFEVTNTGTVEVLHQFDFADGSIPLYGLVFDRNGNLYGATASGGTGSDGGTVFELSPSGGGWTFNLLYSLPGQTNGEGPPGSGAAALSMDAQGNLYGITVNGGPYGQGTVFKLTPSQRGYIYTDLHDFTGGADGGTPWTDVAIDSQGNLYGTASSGGTYSGGTLWEITP